MKKHLSNFFSRNLVIACMAMLISVIFSISAFAVGTCKIQFSDPKTTRSKTFTVTMKVKAEDATKLQKADITVSYNQSAMEFKQGTNAEGGAGTIKITGSGKAKSTKTLEYELKFTALTAGEQIIKVETYEIYDSNDQAVSVSQVGQSKVTIKPSGKNSNNSKLKGLEISPGTLVPEFTPDVLEYSVEVPQDTNNLSINALTEDGDATTTITGNEEFKTGANLVQVNVVAADNVTKRTYVINVTKLESGATGATTTVNDGDKLTAKSLVVTVMTMPDDMQVPIGMEKTDISTYGTNGYSGFIPAGNPDPAFYIFYGMNQAGEIGLYRYDRRDETIQRYFEDPASSQLQEQIVNNTNLSQQMIGLQSKYKTLMIFVGVLAIVVVILLVVLIIKSSSKKSGKSKKNKYDDDDDDFGKGFADFKPEKHNKNYEDSYSFISKESYDDKTFEEENGVEAQAKNEDEQNQTYYQNDTPSNDVIDLD